MELTKRLKIKRVVVLAYYLQANKMMEYSHKSIIEALSKILDRGSTNWIQNLPIVL